MIYISIFSAQIFFLSFGYISLTAYRVSPLEFPTGTWNSIFWTPHIFFLWSLSQWIIQHFARNLGGFLYLFFFLSSIKLPNSKFFYLLTKFVYFCLHCRYSNSATNIPYVYHGGSLITTFFVSRSPPCSPFSPYFLDYIFEILQ